MTTPSATLLRSSSRYEPAVELRPRLDAAVWLGLMIMLFAVIPARFIVPGATDLGRPALIVGFLLFFWWVVTRFSPALTAPGQQPIRWAFFVFFGVLLVGYAVGFLRGLTTMESNSADRTMLYFCVFGGAVLITADGLTDRGRLERLITVLVAGATLVAALGVVEYVLHRDLTEYLSIPGLQAKGWLPVVQERGSSIRVASTTTHYIEMAAYLALILPFAVHRAIFSRRYRGVAVLTAVVIAAGIASTVSRTGIIAVAIVLLVLPPLWTWRTRFNAVMVAVAVGAAGAAASPGLARTLLHLFDTPTQDSSIMARYNRYPLAFSYINQRPWLGRGTGTWVSPQYQIMDNQWLETLLANGILGALAYAALHLTAFMLAWAALRRSRDRETRHLCGALMATQLIGLAVAATFDSLAFLTFATTLALTIGLCGAVWRLTRTPDSTLGTTGAAS